MFLFKMFFMKVFSLKVFLGESLVKYLSKKRDLLTFEVIF